MGDSYMDLAYVAGAVLTAVVALWGITWKLTSASEARLVAAMADLKQELRTETSGLKQELRAEIASALADLNRDLKDEIATLRTDHAERLTSIDNQLTRIEEWARTSAQVTVA